MFSINNGNKDYNFSIDDLASFVNKISNASQEEQTKESLARSVNAIKEEDTKKTNKKYNEVTAEDLVAEINKINGMVASVDEVGNIILNADGNSIVYPEGFYYNGMHITNDTKNIERPVNFFAYVYDNNISKPKKQNNIENPNTIKTKKEEEKEPEINKQKDMTYKTEQYNISASNIELTQQIKEIDEKIAELKQNLAEDSYNIVYQYQLRDLDKKREQLVNQKETQKRQLEDIDKKIKLEECTSVFTEGYEELKAQENELLEQLNYSDSIIPGLYKDFCDYLLIFEEEKNIYNETMEKYTHLYELLSGETPIQFYDDDCTFHFDHYSDETMELGRMENKEMEDLNKRKEECKATLNEKYNAYRDELERNKEIGARLNDVQARLAELEQNPNLKIYFNNMKK